MKTLRVIAVVVLLLGLYSAPCWAPMIGDGMIGGGLTQLVDDVTPQLGSDLDLNGYNLDFPTTPNISDVLDEDDMASDSATKLCTQQSIKAYIDDNAPGLDEKFTGGATIQAMTANDTTPDVSEAATGVNNFYSVTDDDTTVDTITDFDDGDDHSEFSDGDWFVLEVDNQYAKIDFSANANIEGNAGVDFTGSDTQIVYLLFVYRSARWNCVNLTQGFSDPTTLAITTIQGAMNVITDADGITLTAEQMNSIILMTGAGDVDIPADQCDTATGKWVTVKSTAAHLNSLTSNDASDLFVLSDGTELDAQDELDLAGAAGNQVTCTCLAVNKWYVTGEIGTCVDGGVAD